MKKILSLSLAAVMALSAIPMAFAAEAGGNWAGGTAVDVTGEKTVVAADGSETHNAEYTLTVPAKLAPGASGTVTLDGYWPSNATVKVTADAKVNMVHSINSINTRDLVVTFDGIEAAGKDFGSQTWDANVAVAAMPEGAMFGTWHGVFNYMIDYNGEAAGTVTPTPTPDPVEPDENGVIRTFVTGVDYQYDAENYQQWGQWIESDYNVDNFYLDEKGNVRTAEGYYVYVENSIIKAQSGATMSADYYTVKVS